jgi:hypothetical protein
MEFSFSSFHSHVAVAVNLSDLISKCCSGALFAVAKLLAIFHT